MNDHELAAHLAHEAGRILLEVRDSRKHHGKDLGRAGDREANALLVHALRELRPDDGLLSEEEKDSPVRLSKARTWIVDPLDGTREYGEERSDWAVHVALAIDGAPVIGAVALPALDLVLRTDQPAPISPAPQRPRMVVSRTRPAREATAEGSQGLRRSAAECRRAGRTKWPRGPLTGFSQLHNSALAER